MGERIKKCICLIFCVITGITAAGCSIMGQDTGQRVAVEFTVVPADEVPSGLMEIIESHKTEEIQMTWEGDEGMYLIRGYGEQPTGGYSIIVDAVELGEDGLHVTTTLIGPSNEEKPAQEPSCPYIVLRVEDARQDVIFEP